jgi:hypothetical protein
LKTAIRTHWPCNRSPSIPSGEGDIANSWFAHNAIGVLVNSSSRKVLTSFDVADVITWRMRASFGIETRLKG